MKNISTFFSASIVVAGIFISLNSRAQAPEKISYQAVLRNSSNELIKNRQMGMRISILQGTADGTAVYTETQTPSTNGNGLITLEIGAGTVVLGDFSGIDWSAGPYFLKTEADPDGGSDYTITGTTQLLSVPYALHAKTADNTFSGDYNDLSNPPDLSGYITTETDPVYTNSQAANITAADITNLGNLSGVNTGDQDISGIAKNTQAIKDTASQIRADIPDVSGFISAETDPVFNVSVAKKINKSDTIKWNNKLDAEVDGSITNELQILSISNDTLYLTDGGFVKLPDERDPLFDTSLAAGITPADTAYWNHKSDFSGDYADLNNTPSVAHQDSFYLVKLSKNDEDYVNFGNFQNFTNNASWAVIERVKMPAGTGADGGWHFFRGKAWEDKEGDIAIQIKSTQIYAWLRKGGWQHVEYDATFNEDQWYDICFQYNASTNTLELYVDGQLRAQQTGISPQDDSGNTNNLFWGGQDVDPSNNQGDLYSEASITVANQVWLQRTLTPEEIQNYDGHINPDPAIFFSSEINQNLVMDGSGNGHNGTNGNTPEYLTQKYDNGSEFNQPVHINDLLNVQGDLTVAGTIGSTAGGFKFPDGTIQTSAAAPKHYVGEWYGGGIVFWIDETGEHGLICAKSDQDGGSGIRWYASSGTYTYTMAKGDGPYAGELNTAIIIANQGNGDGNTYAARICNELQVTEGGKTYGNWYLPSKEELNLMYQNKAIIDATATANGGVAFTTNAYWSSSETSKYGSWKQYFNNGNPIDDNKGATGRVRAVRAF